MRHTLITLVVTATLLTACNDSDPPDRAGADPAPTNSIASPPATEPSTTEPDVTVAPTTTPAVVDDVIVDEIESLLAASLVDISWDCCGVAAPATGASVAVRIPGKEDVLVGTGSTIDGAPFDPGAPFSASGVAVGLVQSVALRLIDDGVLDPAATVDTWAPQMRDASTTTVQMLLDNATGWGDFDGAVETNVLADLGRLWTLGEVVDVAATLTPTDGVGSEIEATVLGYILETVTGTSLSTLVADVVTEPLGLDSTTIDHTAPFPEGYQHGVFVLGGTLLDTATIDSTAFYSFLGAAASARSTLPDLLDLLDAWVTGDLLGPQHAAADRSFPESEATANGASASYQPGLPVLTYRVTRADGSVVSAIGRRPNNVGTTTFVWYFPETGISVAMHHNSQEWRLRDPLSALAVNIHDLVAVHG